MPVEAPATTPRVAPLLLVLYVTACNNRYRGAAGIRAIHSVAPISCWQPTPWTGLPHSQVHVQDPIHRVTLVLQGNRQTIC